MGGHPIAQLVPGTTTVPPYTQSKSFKLVAEDGEAVGGREAGEWREEEPTPVMSQSRLLIRCSQTSTNGGETCAGMFVSLKRGL